MGSVGVAASSFQSAAIALYCDKPASDQAALIAETAVSPIWRVDLQKTDLGYIDDDMSASSVVLELIAAAEAAADNEPLAASGEFGMRLDNGWSLGLTYETIDASVQVGTAVLPDPASPVYEGPLFVATLKFR